ncbi:MAG: DUF434 domain-containing protein [Planctomycetes bacterium]|nr:DUF434 domain-containing protein [Planctomycetota bacterium]
MPDRRVHRGPHPEDRRLFAPTVVPVLRSVVADLAMLLSKGYAEKSSLAIVGDHFSLTQRQRVAVMRAACSDAARDGRYSRRVEPDDARGKPLLLDGYNVLTTVEAALAGGVVMACRDGTFRDMASVHGTYRKVSETIPALELVGRALADIAPSNCLWYLDSPVSNSGRLKKIMEEAAADNGWAWRVETVTDPDRRLSAAAECVATSDSVILDRCRQWLNLARLVVERSVPDAWIIDLER